MANSIKLILELRGMQQKELITEEWDKKQISKWVLGKRKIPRKIQMYWSELLQIDSSYFIDEQYYCKMITEDEEAEIREYILNQKLSESKMVIVNDLDLEIYDRQTRIDREMRKIVKEVKNDVNDTTGIIEESTRATFDCIEENQKFYKAFLHLRQKHVLEMDEWKSVLRAIAYIGREVNENKSDEMALELYAVLKKYKQIKENQRLKDYKEYIELYENDKT